MEVNETVETAEQPANSELAEAFHSVLDDEADTFERFVDGPENRQIQLDLYADTDNGKSFNDLPESVRTSIEQTVDTYAQETRQLIDRSRKFAEGDSSEEAKSSARELTTRAFQSRVRSFREAKARRDEPGESGFTQEDKEAMYANSRDSAKQAMNALLFTK